MKKIKSLLTFVMVSVFGSSAFAQSSMLATLSHDGEITTFYGAAALKEAYAAAANGDVITLSSGSFNAVNLGKGITIRGAGMAIDNSAQTEPTVINGDFDINIPDETTERLTLEGLYSNHTVTIRGNFRNGTFLKDRFNGITCPNDDNTITNLTMIHCKVADGIHIPANSSVSCVNCMINGVNVYSSESSNYEFLNCVVHTYAFQDYYVGASSFKNCVLYQTDNGVSIAKSAVVYNCVGIGSSNLFKNIPNTTNTIKEASEVFKTYTGTYNDNETFELTDNAKTAFLGIDGTEIGIYGGNMPFSSTPTNPQITKCNVAAKSTADGKLSVDITVNGAE